DEELAERLVGGVDRGVHVTAGDGDDDRLTDDLARLRDLDHERAVVADTVLTVDLDGLEQLSGVVRVRGRVLPDRGASTRDTELRYLERGGLRGRPLDELPGAGLVGRLLVDRERPRRHVAGLRTGRSLGERRESDVVGNHRLRGVGHVRAGAV